MKLSELEMLIDKYLSGKATDEEKEIVDNWLQHNPRRPDYQPAEKAGTDHCHLEQRIDEDQPAGNGYQWWCRSEKHWLASKKYLIRVAASLLFIATAGILFHYFTKRDSTTTTRYASITASDSTAMEHLLPDGSKAWLFPGSSIHIPANYNEQNRHVQVTGRAFFDVKQDISKPFYVDAGSMQTRVLGTTFEVNTLREKFPAVVVKSGRVAVSWEGKELSQLSLNKRITLDLSGANAACSSGQCECHCTLHLVERRFQF